MASPYDAQPASILAAGSVSAAGAVVSPVAGAGARNWTVAAPVMSVFTITLGAQCDVTERVVLLTVRDILDSIATVSAGTDATIVVSTGTASTGAAADKAFDFVCYKLAF